MAATAKRLIEKNGRLVTLRKVATEDAVLNAAKPWRGNDASAEPEDGGPVEYEAKAVILDFKLADGTSDLARRGFKRALVAANSVVDDDGAAIDLSDVTQIVDGAQTWQVTEVAPLVPGDTTLLYQMTVKV